MAFRPHGPIFELRIVMFCEFRIVTHSPVDELIRTFSITVPLFPSMTTGPVGASEPPDPDGVGVGDFVLVGVGTGEGLVLLGAVVGSFVALGELLEAGIVGELGAVAVLGCDVGAGAVLGCDVGCCVVGGAGVGVALVDIIGEAVGGAVALLFATVNCPRRLEVLPFDHFRTTRIVCEPSASFVVSYGRAVPSPAVPAKSKGGVSSVWAGGLVRLRLSR